MAGHCLLNGPVAQWLAQATHNRLVTGSNPVGPTFYSRSLSFNGERFVLSNMQTESVLVGYLHKKLKGVA